MLIGYARVSTEEQSLEMQHAALLKAGCERIFQDAGTSGATSVRPGLENLLAELETGDTLVVWRLDRLGRSLAHLISTVTRLEKRGVNFCSLSENIDTTTSGGRLVFHIMGAMAEFERALISERTRAGMITARTSGRRMGRPPALGTEEESEVWHALAQGASKQEIAARFGISLRTVNRLVQRGAGARTISGRLLRSSTC